MIILLPAVVSALDINVKPDNVVPGDVILLKLSGPDADSFNAVFDEKDVKLSREGNNALLGLIPVDINLKPDKYEIVISNGKSVHRVTVTVRDHEFRTVHLTLPEEKVTLSPENQKRVEREFILQNRIWKTFSPRLWVGRFLHPINTDVSTGFGIKRIMNRKKISIHRGMDFRGRQGTPVHAINAGKVALAKDLFYGGNTLIIDHGMGLFSVYMHLSKINVNEGDSVIKGQVIGNVGMSGRATGPHLHLSVKLNGVSVNPVSLFKLSL